jgi:hypothetical protein
VQFMKFAKRVYGMDKVRVIFFSPFLIGGFANFYSIGDFSRGS